MRLSILVLLVFILFQAGCSSGPEQEPALAEAYVGPSTLQVREELTAHSELAATVKHGERLDLIGRRRRFYKVRTAGGAEGWVDGRQLLTKEDMEELKTLAAKVAQAPSQGRATVYEPLNVHNVPNRQSPSFFQIKPDSWCDVIANQRTPRIPFVPADFIQADPVGQILKKAKKKKEPPKVPPPPPGKAPGVPGNWLDLSGNPLGLIPEKQEADDSKEAKAGPPMDEWTLVRAKDGRAGWVLSRMLQMSIPDEVAQYAERARIVAYFAMGSVRDKDVEQKIWLWATLARGGFDHQFDSLRIFTWSTRRHRYETSFIERNMQGWLPIQLSGQEGFRVVVREKDGQLSERTYTLSGFRARVTARKPAQLPAPWYVPRDAAKPAPQGPQPEQSWKEKARSLVDKVKSKLKR